MIKATLCEAICSNKVIQFYYSLGDDPGLRIVEPHMVAYTTANHLSLSAWYLRGRSESREGQGWRDYLISGISRITILDETFAGPRRGYNPSGGKKFHNVQCALQSRLW
jgi:predicted DNA-binding transcriptional regulator YafY